MKIPFLVYSVLESEIHLGSLTHGQQDLGQGTDPPTGFIFLLCTKGIIVINCHASFCTLKKKIIVAPLAVPPGGCVYT